MEEKSEKGKRPLEADVTRLSSIHGETAASPCPPLPGKFILIFLSRGDDSMDFTRGHSRTRQSPSSSRLPSSPPPPLLPYRCLYLHFSNAAISPREDECSNGFAKARLLGGTRKTIIIQRRRALKRLVRRRPVSYLYCASAIRDLCGRGTLEIRPGSSSQQLDIHFLRLSPRREGT